MKLWVDDLRYPPAADWTWVQTSAAALWYLNIWIKDGISADNKLTMSLDHDLGGDDTTRPVVLWLIDNGVRPWIDEIGVHTANPVGREWLQGMIDRYLTPTEGDTCWTCGTGHEDPLVAAACDDIRLNGE